MKEELGKICRSWEILRIAFNIILVGSTIAGYVIAPIVIEMSNSEILNEVKRNSLFLIGLPFMGVGANLLFLFGPLFETYLFLFGLNKTFIRWLIFILGTGASAFVAFMVTVEFSHYAAFK